MIQALYHGSALIVVRADVLSGVRRWWVHQPQFYQRTGVK